MLVMDDNSQTPVEQLVRAIAEQVIAVGNNELLSPDLLTEKQAVKKYGHSAGKLQMWRANGRLVKGIHWVKNDGSVRYIPEMMLDRFINWEDDNAHERAVDAWKKAQLSSVKRRRSSAA